MTTLDTDICVEQSHLKKLKLLERGQIYVFKFSLQQLHKPSYHWRIPIVDQIYRQVQDTFEFWQSNKELVRKWTKGTQFLLSSPPPNMEASIPFTKTHLTCLNELNLQAQPPTISAETSLPHSPDFPPFPVF